MTTKTTKTTKGVKPLYVVKLGDDGYYAGKSAWKPVPKVNADKLTHKDVRSACGKLRRLGYHATVEPA